MLHVTRCRLLLKFLEIICAPLHSLEPQRESRRLILSRLLRHWQPAAKLFLRMIATFQPYPVSVSCNCLPTLGDPAWLFRLHCCVQRAVSLFNPKANPRCVRLLGIIKYLAVPNSLLGCCEYLIYRVDTVEVWARWCNRLVQLTSG